MPPSEPVFIEDEHPPRRPYPRGVYFILFIWGVSSFMVWTFAISQAWAYNGAPEILFMLFLTFLVAVTLSAGTMALGFGWASSLLPYVPLSIAVGILTCCGAPCFTPLFFIAALLAHLQKNQYCDWYDGFRKRDVDDDDE